MKEHIILFARHTAGLVRQVRQSRQSHPSALLASIRGRLAKLWDTGCHDDRLSVVPTKRPAGAATGLLN